MKRLWGRLTYANVMSTIAVFLVLGGGAAVAAGGLGKNTVGPRQLKKNAVTAAKIKNGAVTGAKIKAATLPPVPSAANASALGGLPPSSYLVRSATVVGGALVPTQSDGIAQANLSQPTAGLVCIDGLNPAPRTAVAALNFESDNEGELFVQVAPAVGGCAGKQVAVATEKGGGGFLSQPFSVIIH